MFLEPVLEYMVKLWHDRVQLWDEFHGQLKALIFITITDHPIYHWPYLDSLKERQHVFSMPYG